MPLGQTPFGTRSPPDPQPDPQRPPPSRLRPSWLFIVLAGALAVSLLIQARRGEKKPVNDSTECITDRNCGAGWRCFAVPKEDGFAVTGVCSRECSADADCAAPLHCAEVMTGDHQVVAVGARGGTEPRLHVCRP